MPQGRSNSLAPVHIRFSRLHDKFRPLENLADADCSIKLPLPECTRGNESVFVIYLKISYPIPTHSRHNLIALLRTVAASPRKTPKHSITVPITKSAVCAAAFSQCINSITLSFFRSHKGFIENNMTQRSVLNSSRGRYSRYGATAVYAVWIIFIIITAFLLLSVIRKSS